MTFEYKMKLIF